MRIYHYTSVDTLEKILSGKSILFRRLDCVDDVMEYTVSEFAKYMFISCWTESKEENIPLWKMYTTDITKVLEFHFLRICLKHILLYQMVAM